MLPGVCHFPQLSRTPAIPRGRVKYLSVEPLPIANSIPSSVDEFVTNLVQYLRGKITSGHRGSSVIDLALVSMYFTMDVITRLAFGDELGFMKTDSDVYGLLEQTRVALKVAFIPLVVPWFRDIVMSRPLIRFLRPQPTDKKGFGVALK